MQPQISKEIEDYFESNNIKILCNHPKRTRYRSKLKKVDTAVYYVEVYFNNGQFGKDEGITYFRIDGNRTRVKTIFHNPSLSKEIIKEKLNKIINWINEN